MTDSSPTIAPGGSYFVVYSGGPFDGQTEERDSRDGSWDAAIPAYAAVDGQETELTYVAVSAKEINDSVFVTYALDAKDSDPIEAPEDRNDNHS